MWKCTQLERAGCGGWRWVTGGDGRVTQEAVGAGNCGLSHSLGWLQGLLWGILRRGILLQPRGLLEASKYTASIQTSTFGCFAFCQVWVMNCSIQWSAAFGDSNSKNSDLSSDSDLISPPTKLPVVNFLRQCHNLSSSRFTCESPIWIFSTKIRFRALTLFGAGHLLHISCVSTRSSRETYVGLKLPVVSRLHDRKVWFVNPPAGKETDNMVSSCQTGKILNFVPDINVS